MPRRPKVTVTTDLDTLAREMVPQPMLMVRPHHTRKFANGRRQHIAEVVDLATLNITAVETFETA
jgi:hypothetical protein